MTDIPQGWIVHPNNPNYIYNPTTQQVVARPQAPAPAIAAAPAPVSEQPWGEQDLTQAAQDLESNKARSDFSRDGNFIWVNFPRKAAEESIYSRFLPPWDRNQRKAYVESFRHRIYARLVPDAPENRDVINFDCFDVLGGPGNCDICRVLEQNIVYSSARGAEDFHQQAKRKASATWQMLDLQNPSRHYQSLKDSQGQEYTGIVPGLFRVGPQLHSDILTCFRNGNFTHHEIGFPIECIRKQTGSGKFDVEYKANHMAHHSGPIDPALINVLYNLINLRKEAIIFVKRERFQMIAQNILSYYGGANHGQVQVPASFDPGQWVVHPQAPGYEYNTITKQVRQITAPSAPPVSPAMPAAPVPPAFPPAAAMPAAPAPMAPPLPPPAPPAGIPGAPMAGNQAFPPPAAPGLAAGVQLPAVPPVAAPGIPSVVGAQPPAVPPAASVPMSPDQLQQNFTPPPALPTGGQQPPPPPPPLPTGGQQPPPPPLPTGGQPPPPVMPPAPTDPGDPGSPPF